MRHRPPASPSFGRRYRRRDDTGGATIHASAGAVRLTGLDTHETPCVNRARVALMSLLRRLPLLLLAFVVLTPVAGTEGAPEGSVQVSLDSNGSEFAAPSGAYSYPPSISSDGNYVAFQSLGAIVPQIQLQDGVAKVIRDGDANNVEDVLRRDLAQSVTTIVSLSTEGKQGDNRSYAPDITADGAAIVFESLASNLVAGDGNNAPDIFLRDLTAGTTTRISIGSDGADANGASFRPAISSDGAYIAFCSRATNLVRGDTGGAAGAFVYERATGKVTKIPLEAGTSATAGCERVAIDDNGSVVAVAALTGANSNVYTYGRASGTATPLTAAGDGSSGLFGLAVSGDGGTVVFDSAAANLVPNDTNRSRDVFAAGVAGGQTTRVSVRSDGTQLPGDSGTSGVAISGDGRFVVFGSAASEVVPGDSNGREDIFRHELATGQTTIVSVSMAGQPANDSSYAPDTNADGSVVAYASLAANVVTGDTNRNPDIFVRGQNFPDHDGEKAPEDTGAPDDNLSLVAASPVDEGNTRMLEYIAGGIAGGVLVLAGSWFLLGRRGRA